ncbi:MAG: bifunctional DNA-formamidopyrimidine glycosylase/DNA-(apurinic or apyrimidinic site) lyase [Anaerolineae bacterium]|nr:bifunctional DNA-formamidopyrimidine glycosylase/DNA-(apurinic or apyrimidinic site) lyase [Anaerolineae bacterium]MDQ7034964.1 bifunctional DNA-formamidopyrimidine glycosylase/DNA-(apurinic or apyrimidinic site) lyase [Anaerolineae bacterium]
MPELPEVETVVRGLRQPLIGHTIESMWYDWENSIALPHANEFEGRVVGQTVIGIRRRAKYIVIELDKDLLLVHLRMTGRLYVAEENAVQRVDKWVHVKFGLDGAKELRFSDSRKFGKVYLTDNIDDVTGGIGPEPLEDTFTVAVFKERLTGRRKVIKSLLLDQHFIAGVGNIYADEALHRAAIHPQRSADSLSDEEIVRLYTTVRAVLAAGIQHEGASINWYRKPDGTQGESQKHFYVYGRDGQDCLTCGQARIEKSRIAQRGTHFCPNCQK